MISTRRWPSTLRFSGRSCIRGVFATTEQAQAYLSGEVEADDPFQLTDMEDTVRRLLWAIDHQELIAVYGDYDVDGVTATALLTQVLRRYGAEVIPYIPNRFDEGYGLNVEALETLVEQGVRLVITVDCGIRSPREAERAEELGIDLIISDHHHPGEELPDAFTVICPKRSGDGYPDKDLSGVGLAYKIAQALALRRPEAGVARGGLAGPGRPGHGCGCGPADRGKPHAWCAKVCRPCACACCKRVPGCTRWPMLRA